MTAAEDIARLVPALTDPTITDNTYVFVPLGVLRRLHREAASLCKQVPKLRDLAQRIEWEDTP